MVKYVNGYALLTWGLQQVGFDSRHIYICNAAPHWVKWSVSRYNRRNRWRWHSNSFPCYFSTKHYGITIVSKRQFEWMASSYNWLRNKEVFLQHILNRGTIGWLGHGHQLTRCQKIWLQMISSSESLSCPWWLACIINTVKSRYLELEYLEFCELEASIWIKNTFWLLSPVIIWR